MKSMGTGKLDWELKIDVQGRNVLTNCDFYYIYHTTLKISVVYALCYLLVTEEAEYGRKDLLTAVNSLFLYVKDIYINQAWYL